MLSTASVQIRIFYLDSIELTLTTGKDYGMGQKLSTLFIRF